MKKTQSDETTQRFIVAANWKTNPESLKEALSLFESSKAAARTLRSTDIILAPPLVFLYALTSEYSGQKVRFAAQDLSVHEAGSHTGEVSGEQIKNAGAACVIVGHSERRAAGEDDELVKEKTARALDAGLHPIVCIGEKKRDDEGAYLEVIRKQLEAIFFGMSKDWFSRVTIAYEPIWAIGKTAEESVTPHALHETAIYIRKVLVDLFDKRHALACPILYGGSVEPENAEELISNTGVNGFLVGHASLTTESFGKIVSTVETYAKGRQ